MDFISLFLLTFIIEGGDISTPKELKTCLTTII